jgi:hypothetical protein
MAELDPQERTAEKRMLAAMVGRGVTEVFTVTVTPEFPGSALWLVVTSDRERDQLLADGLWLRELARMAFREAGFGERHVARALTTVESQETVDRDHAGNWFAAIRSRL